MISQFNKFYRSIIGQDTENGIDTEAKKKSTKKTSKTSTKTKTINKIADALIGKQEKKANSINQSEQKEQTDNGVKTLEKDFLDKFIRYNELQLLMRDLPEIANSFKSIQGFDEQLIRDTAEKLLADRQKEIDTLTKDLTSLRDKITKEAEVANYKKSVIDIFDQQSDALVNKNKPDNVYGYTPRDNGEAYNNGETLAGQDGIPTVSVGMPEVTDNGPDMMQPEELPTNNGEPQEVEDLPQAIEKDADTVELPEIPEQTGKITKAQLKKLEKTNLSTKPVLIDSKKSKRKSTKK